MAQRLSQALILANIVSGILLAPTAYLAFATGFCSIYPGLARILTLGITGDPSVCLAIHTGPAPMIASIAAMAHIVTSTEIIAARLKDEGVPAKILIGAYRLTAWTLASLALILATTHYLG